MELSQLICDNDFTRHISSGVEIAARLTVKAAPRKFSYLLDSHENNSNCCHHMSDFNAKMHQIRFRLGLCPRPHRKNLQRSPWPPSWWGDWLPLSTEHTMSCHAVPQNAHSFVHRRSSSHRDPLFLQRCPTTSWITGAQL